MYVFLDADILMQESVQEVKIEGHDMCYKKVEPSLTHGIPPHDLKTDRKKKLALYSRTLCLRAKRCSNVEVAMGPVLPETEPNR